MAFGILPAPGKIVNGIEIGPCINACAHLDCQKTREMAAEICPYCRAKIGYETPFQDTLAGLAHRDCHETHMDLAVPLFHFGIRRRRAVDNIPPSGNPAAYFLVDYHSNQDPGEISYGIFRLTDSMNHARRSIIKARETQLGRTTPAWPGAQDWRGRIYGAREFIAAAEVYVAYLRGQLARIERQQKQALEWALTAVSVDPVDAEYMDSYTGEVTCTLLAEDIAAHFNLYDAEDRPLEWVFEIAFAVAEWVEDGTPTRQTLGW